MSIARVYYMHAKEGRTAELESGLRNLVEKVSRIAGSHGAELLRDTGNERQFMLIERWEDLEAHKASKAEFAKIDMGSIMESLEGPPAATYFDSLAAA